MVGLRIKISLTLFSICAGLFCVSSSSARFDEREDFFESRIRPLLVTHCYDCHTGAAKGGLRLDSREALLKGGKRGPAIIPGDPDGSLLLNAVRHDGPQMPKGAAKLKDTEIADLARWVKDGAVWPTSAPAKAKNEYLIKTEHKTFWSFQPVTNPAVPSVKGKTANAIDAFLLAQLEAKGLAFNPPADKRTLIRRATYDLTGLPPTQEEIAAFIADRSPGAFAKVVDRLLASPHYGERWARHWLDLARYSDTIGMIDAGKNLQGWYPYAYTYRDWVIRAFNEDLPYDQFVLQQIAADRLPKNDARNLAALGFLSLSRGGLGINAHEKIDDKIDVVSRGLLGLTVSCARCHNHKFDPIPTADYYSFYTIFDNTREPKQLPLLGAQTVDGRWEAELKEEEQKIEADIRKMREKRYPELKSLYRTEPEIAKSLRGVYESRELKTDAELQEFAREKDYNLYFLKRWREYLQKAGDDEVWTIWHRLAALSEKEFKEKAAQTIAAITDRKLLPLVAAAFQKTPASMREVADIYGKLIAAYDKPSPLPDAPANKEEERLRLILHAADAPTNAPFSDYEQIRLSTDRQNEDGRRRKLESLFLAQAYRGAPPRAQSLEDTPELKPGHVFLRGKPENKGENVQPRFLLILAGENRRPFTEGSGRLELARAIADRNNPLTSRVIVNRVWQRHFGAGLVRTPSDFGTRGDPPTHPELLDHLARTFVDDGWSLKKLHRRIMLSRAYRQGSEDNAAARLLDPENKLLWRFNRRRLDAEELRDSLLVASGKLDRAMGGLPVSAQAWPFTSRRTIYSFIDRALVPNDLRVFDFPNAELHSAGRDLTTSPQQALMMMNSAFVIEQAKAVIERPEVAAEPDPRKRIERLYRLIYGRAPTREEVRLGLDFIRDPANGGNEQTPLDEQRASAWRYGQGEFDEKTCRVKSFTPFRHFLLGAWRSSAMPGDPRTPTASISKQGGFNGDDASKALVRRWIAPFDGEIAITGQGEQAFHIACDRCDGPSKIEPAKPEAASRQITVHRGDAIDFVVTSRKSDDSPWAVTIKRIGAESETWDSVKDFHHPAASRLSGWARYAQVLLASVEFVMVD
ncbi:MAG: PSD1 and planctomycete cytochrome C domain-containing protein [Blastocatellia bacterium]